MQRILGNPASCVAPNRYSAHSRVLSMANSSFFCFHPVHVPECVMLTYCIPWTQSSSQGLHSPTVGAANLASLPVPFSLIPPPTGSLLPLSTARGSSLEWLSSRSTRHPRRRAMPSRSRRRRSRSTRRGRRGCLFRCTLRRSGSLGFLPVARTD